MLTKMRLLTPGPTPLPEEVRLAMAADMVHHRKPGFASLLVEVQERLKRLFGTKTTVISLTASGTGAMVAALANLFSPGDKVLVIEGGKFGERFREIGQAQELTPEVLSVPWGQAVDPADVAARLDADPSIKAVLVQASETSTGVLHPVRQLAEVTRRREALLVVDGISAVGISPLPMDEWGVDCVLTGSQKGLMVPPGLAFVAMSERAWARAEQKKKLPFYFNLLAERDKQANGSTMFTPAIGLFVGLRESLRMFDEAGYDQVYRKQWALTMMVRAGIERLGLTLLAPTHFTWGLTSVRLPSGVDASRVLARAAADHGVIMAGGQGHLKGRIVRLGHMGHVDFGDIVAGLYALRQALVGEGAYLASADFLEYGLTAYEEALATGYPQL